MTDQCEQPAEPATATATEVSGEEAGAGDRAAEVSERIGALCELSAHSQLPVLTLAERRRLVRRPVVVASTEVPEVRAARREALHQLRVSALEVAERAADAVLLIDDELAALTERVRVAARELSRDPSRSMHERMMLIGLWAPLPRRAAGAAQRHLYRRRREAARARRARTPR